METSTLTSDWKVDTNHSTIGFRVKHLGIAEITGSFGEFEGSVKVTDNAFSIGEVRLRIQTDSISTGNTMRDNHLKTEEFLDTATYPQILFESTNVVKQTPTQYVVNGLLTIRDVTKPVQLKVDKLGLTRDMWGNEVAVFQVHGSFNRQDFNVKWHHLLDTGAAVVGNEIHLNMNVELMPAA